MSSLSRPFVVGCNKCQEKSQLLGYKRLFTTTTNVSNLIKSLGTTVFAIQNYCIQNYIKIMYVMKKKNSKIKADAENINLELCPR